MGVRAVAVDLGDPGGVAGEEIKAEVELAGRIVGEAADIPVLRVAVLAGGDEVLADFAEEVFALGPVGRDVVDEFESGLVFVHMRAVGDHLPWRVDGDVIGELSR